MSKTSFLFTGQGAQYAGMGKDLYEKYDLFKQIIDEASAYLKINLPQIFESSTALEKTNNAQSAVFAVSYGIYKLLQNENIKPNAIAGFSLGEITSLAAAEILSFTDALDLIKERGRIMDEACTNVKGAMYSVIGAEDAAIEEVCADIRKRGGYVIPANYNCPGQVVISGEIQSVEEAVKIFAGKKIRTIKLNVAGAFHSKLMEYKKEELAELLENLDFKKSNSDIDLYSNVTGNKFDFANISEANIKSFMTDYIPKQMANPVKFREELENMDKSGCKLYIEIGAGKVLSGLVKRTCKDSQIANIQDFQTLESVLELF
jgi:[acyl-carrier-protein] S-malonyltransferase